MGKDAATRAIFPDGPDEGRLQFEGDKLLFRGARRAVWTGEALKGLRAEAEPAIPALMKLVEDHVGGEVENRAIETLGELGPAAKCAVPLLTKTAESGGEDISYRAVDALGNIGPDANTALPTLQKLLNSNNSYLVRRVKEANLKISAPINH